MTNILRTSELYDCKVPYLKDFFSSHLYPWEMLPDIKKLVMEILSNGPDGFTYYSEDILIGQNVKISDHADICGPAVIGHNTEIRPGAYIRGNVITGENCVIGNSCELKNCILLDRVQVPHYNYVGDSILGNYSHLGAGSICSNLKNDNKNIVIHGSSHIDTGLRKVGAMLGDHANVGSSCVLNPGTVICRNSSVYPLTSVRGVILPDMIVKSMDNIVAVRRD